MEKYQYYVLFNNHDNGIRLHVELKKMGVHATIAPTPRALSTCCGISLLINENDITKVEEILENSNIEINRIEKIERDINPNRDRYC